MNFSIDPKDLNLQDAAGMQLVEVMRELADEVEKLPPTEEQIAEAVDDWLSENIDPETGYVLDSTLTMSNAAAPADKVGVLNSAVTLRKDIVYNLKKYDNYIAISPVTPFSAALKSDYIHTVNQEPSFSTENYTTANVDARFDITEVSAVGICNVKLVIYIEDVTEITSLYIELIPTSYSRTVNVASLTNGWNILTFNTWAGTLTTWSTITRVRVYIGRESTSKNVFIGKVIFNTPPKANLIFVSDGAYKSFYTNGYPDLKEIGVPTTWALAPNKIISEDSAYISAENLETLAEDGLSEFSFHSWNSEAETSKSEYEILSMGAKCIRYLQKNGLLPTYPWRAATTQNNSPNVGILKKLVFGIATGTGNYSVTEFPFPNPYNVPRLALHSLTQDQITANLLLMYKTHCTAVIYTHKIQDDSSSDTSTANWEFFVNAIDDAIDGGYLNPTTFNSLMMEYYNPII